MAPILAYWDIRGLVHPIKLLLAYTETQYTNKLYRTGPMPNFLEESDWYPEKFTLGLDFPNLPYYIDGDLKITQSQAIMRYIGRQNDLYGTSEVERVAVDMLMAQVEDVRRGWANLCYVTFETEKEKYLKELPAKFKGFSVYLSDKPWFVGSKVTIADFLIYDMIDLHLHLDKTCIDQFQNLQDYHKRFQELPAIKRYMASPDYIKTPLMWPNAKFGAEK